MGLVGKEEPAEFKRDAGRSIHQRAGWGFCLNQGPLGLIIHAMTTEPTDTAPAFSNATENVCSSASKIGPVEQARSASRRFAAMASAYFLGVFNDNFFKQAACLIAVSVGKADLQGIIFAIYTVPFLLLASQAGWAADRFPKRTVAIAAKMLEVLAAVCGVAGIFLGMWSLIIVMVFLVGVQETFFSPAISGAVPETFDSDYVMKANSMLKVVNTVAFLGIPAAGELLGIPGRVGSFQANHLAIGVVILVTAVIGLAVSFWVPYRPAAHPAARFPWHGPLDTFRTFVRISRDPLLALTVCLDTFIWFLAILQILVINEMGIKQFGFTTPETSRLVCAELAGLAVGGALAEKFSGGPRWHRVLAPGFTFMGVLMLLVFCTPMMGCSPLWILGVLMFLLGAAAGVMMVPLETFVQVRPAPTEKGTVLAAGNFATYFGILLAGLISIPMEEFLRGTTCFCIMGAAMVIVSAGLWHLLRTRKWT